MRTHIRLVNIILRLTQVFAIVFIGLTIFISITSKNVNVSIFDHSIVNLKKELTTFGFGVVFALTIIFLMLLYYTIEMVINVFHLFKEETFFSTSIIKKLRNAGKALLLMGLINFILPIFIGFTSTTGETNIEIQLFGSPMIFVLIGFVLFIFSSALNRARAIQQENKLTI